jgi:antitoxin MazE
MLIVPSSDKHNLPRNAKTVVYTLCIPSVYYESTYIRGEFMLKAQVVKWGNSLAVRIPKAVAQEALMEEGDAVVIKAARNRIELLRTEKVPTLKELVSQITPENRHEETAWGRERGKEIIEW